MTEEKKSPFFFGELIIWDWFWQFLEKDNRFQTQLPPYFSPSVGSEEYWKQRQDFFGEGDAAPDEDGAEILFQAITWNPENHEPSWLKSYSRLFARDPDFVSAFVAFGRGRILEQLKQLKEQEQAKIDGAKGRSRGWSDVVRFVCLAELKAKDLSDADLLDHIERRACLPKPGMDRERRLEAVKRARKRLATELERKGYPVR